MDNTHGERYNVASSLANHEKGHCFEKEHMFFDIRVEGRGRVVLWVKCYDPAGLVELGHRQGVQVASKGVLIVNGLCPQ